MLGYGAEDSRARWGQAVAATVQLVMLIEMAIVAGIGFALMAWYLHR